MKLQRGRDGTQSHSCIPVIPRGCESQGCSALALGGWQQGGGRGPEDMRGWHGAGARAEAGVGPTHGPCQATSSHLPSQPKCCLCWVLLMRSHLCWETAPGPRPPCASQAGGSPGQVEPGMLNGPRGLEGPPIPVPAQDARCCLSGCHAVGQQTRHSKTHRALKIQPLHPWEQDSG